jgi:hypothetical protein
MEITEITPQDEAEDILAEPIDYERYSKWADERFKNIPRERRNKVCFILFIITEFAKAYKMKRPNAVRYLRQYGGWDFIFEHWWALHTEDSSDAVRRILRICELNGGT